MRPEGAWSMSTVGLTAQETSFPIENPFLRGSYCHSMADSKSSWGYPHVARDNFSIKSAYTDPRVHAHHKDPPPPSYESYERHKHSPVTQRLPPKKSLPSPLSLSCNTEPSTPNPAADNHIPSLSVYRGNSPPQTPGRCSKPLPPIPLQTDTCPEYAMDNEVEYFTSTDENCPLVSDQCVKSSKRYGLPRRHSFKVQGQINPAFSDYYRGPQSSRPSQPLHHQVQVSYQAQVKHEPPKQEPPDKFPRPLDKAQRKLRRSQSGPARPPPIPPRLHKTEDHRRWSAEVSSGAYSDEDRPPKVPPREPLSRGSSRTPSPRSLPMYSNGEMPPTQSFAPDPKYVSYRGLQRQNSEGSPCILPVMENGQKASNTHYYLIDGPAPRNTDVSHSEWDYHSRRKPHVDLV